jgi:hypothetical protein
MTLAKRLERQFGPGDRSRGREYFGEGRVHIVRASELGALATVAGSRQYVVLLDWSQLSEDGLLFARCDCPRHEEGIWCKHIWATVLALDAQGITLRTGSPEIHLEFDDPEFDDFGEMDDPDDWEEEPAPRGPDWEQKLTALERFLLVRGRDGEGVKREAGKEILFQIDAGASRAQGELAVSFSSESERGTARGARSGRPAFGARISPRSKTLRSQCFWSFCSAWARGKRSPAAGACGASSKWEARPSRRLSTS